MQDSALTLKAVTLVNTAQGVNLRYVIEYCDAV